MGVSRGPQGVFRDFQGGLTFSFKGGSTGLKGLHGTSWALRAVSGSSRESQDAPKDLRGVSVSLMGVYGGSGGILKSQFTLKKKGGGVRYLEINA